MAEKSILIVEDEPEIFELIRFHIEREGYVSGVIASGQRALEAIRRTPPDLVILDLMLPDLDGLEICRRVRWEESTRHVPILIVSAKGEESDIVAGLELGADDYVTKPFSPKVLMARVRNLLRRVSASGLPGTETADPARGRSGENTRSGQSQAFMFETISIFKDVGQQCCKRGVKGVLPR